MDTSTSPFEPLFPYSRNASIDTTRFAGSTYAAGYGLAAHLLTEHASNDKMDRNLLVFPICYLHRHNLELNIKLLITAAERVVGPTNVRVNHHRIDELWSVAKKLLQQADPEDQDPFRFNKIERAVTFIAAVDEDAQAFRFPNRVSGVRSLANVSEVDLESLAEIVMAATYLLWGCIDWLGDIEQAQRIG